jgi:hypothetical protein
MLRFCASVRTPASMWRVVRGCSISSYLGKLRRVANAGHMQLRCGFVANALLTVSAMSSSLANRWYASGKQRPAHPLASVKLKRNSPEEGKESAPVAVESGTSEIQNAGIAPAVAGRREDRRRRNNALMPWSGASSPHRKRPSAPIFRLLPPGPWLPPSFYSASLATFFRQSDFPTSPPRAPNMYGSPTATDLPRIISGVVWSVPGDWCAISDNRAFHGFGLTRFILRLPRRLVDLHV